MNRVHNQQSVILSEAKDLLFAADGRSFAQDGKFNTQVIPRVDRR
jgi:hypothetical protein